MMQTGTKNQSTHLVITLDGVGAMGPMPFLMKYAFSKHPHVEVRNFVWTHGTGRMLADLRDRHHMRNKAEALAGLVRAEAAGKNVSIVAKSGAAGVALQALDALEVDSVHAVVLLSPAVSPGYDLAQSAKAVRKNVYSFHSPYDLFWLGIGTSLFGTADGVRTLAAGCVGFSTSTPNPKLVQIAWDPKMMLSLNFGDHSGTSMLPFLSKYVLPLLEEAEDAEVGSLSGSQVVSVRSSQGKSSGR